ncbi:hypothetical protein [uncultured Roseobacter sp.]|uniref:hypothetical protein n=1 Tax=uncultured Roseobacter sp. TaxID=114847 RepID=UPI00260EB09F|nr:hypothetical protein [uncultured Roseobacter sp.]
MRSTDTALGRAAETALRGLKTNDLGGERTDFLAPFKTGRASARLWLNVVSLILVVIAVFLVVLVFVYRTDPTALTAFSTLLGLDVAAAVTLIRKNARDLAEMDLAADLLQGLPNEHRKDLLLAIVSGNKDS